MVGNNSIDSYIVNKLKGKPKRRGGGNFWVAFVPLEGSVSCSGASYLSCDKTFQFRWH